MNAFNTVRMCAVYNVAGVVDVDAARFKLLTNMYFASDVK